MVAVHLRDAPDGGCPCLPLWAAPKGRIYSGCHPDMDICPTLEVSPGEECVNSAFPPSVELYIFRNAVEDLYKLKKEGEGGGPAEEGGDEAPEAENNIQSAYELEDPLNNGTSEPLEFITGELSEEIRQALPPSVVDALRERPRLTPWGAPWGRCKRSAGGLQDTVYIELPQGPAGPGGAAKKPKGRVKIVDSFELEAPEDREALIDAVKKLFQQSAVLNDFWSPTDRYGSPASARSETPP